MQIQIDWTVIIHSCNLGSVDSISEIGVVKCSGGELELGGSGVRVEHKCIRQVVV